ncbi:MAG: alpha/beta fold hydrolase, partial [Pseudomonadota bacterium]
MNPASSILSVLPQLQADAANPRNRHPDAGPSAQVDEGAVAAALQGEILARFGRLLDGLDLYRNHAYRRVASAHRPVWAEGGSRLLDFAPDAPAETPAVLIVPSLINRYYILDLDQGASFLGFLAEKGFRPLVIDWGRPGPVEREFTLTDYIAGRLERALQASLAHVSAPSLPVVGYCMGGTLVTALAGRRPDAVSAVVALATPWDFHAGEP